MEIKKTCLHDRHVSLGALMQPFAGFDMPIQYTSITEEHFAVREKCGVFDVSHMGEVMVTGKEAEAFVNHIFTGNVTGAPINQVFYGMMLHPDGGTVDDLLVYKLGEEKFFLVINAANIDKDVAWIKDNVGNFDVTVDNCSDYYAQLAIQGPTAEEVVKTVLQLPCEDIPFYTAKVMNTDGEEIVLSRTGYTGEDGFELYASHKYIVAQWDKLLDSGQCKPCGLGCRDTLRFEVGLPLYGHELSAEISPVMAGLSMFCKLDKEEFIGKDALVKQKAEGVKQRVIGIELEDKAVPRNGYEVLKDGKVVGTVTTGYRCLSVNKSVCMALVETPYASLGSELEVQIRKKTFKGTVVKKRFYDKHYKK